MHRRHFPRPRQVGVCVLLAFGLGCWTSIGANGQAIDRLAFLQLLRDDGFAALEQRLEADENGYQSFSSADPELEPKLNAWVDARPDSEAPRMARAVFYHHLAWITRGSGYARETRRERFAVMHHYLNLATTDLEAVIENNPRFGLAYGHLITIALARGDHAATDMLVRMGLEADPSSYEVRNRYLYSLVPWWRGREGLEIVANFVAEIEKDAVARPDLAPLKGFEDYVAAEILSRNGRREAAIPYYERSLRFGDNCGYLHMMGYSQFALKRHKDAVATFTRALMLCPHSPGILTDRSETFRLLRQFDAAYADNHLALSLDPYNPRLLREEALLLSSQKRYHEALSALDRAAVYGSFDDRIWDYRGRILFRGLNRPRDAAESLRRATKLAPRKAEYWLIYAWALLELADCKGTDAVAVYRELCRTGRPCSKLGLAETTIIVLKLHMENGCPDLPDE